MNDDNGGAIGVSKKYRGVSLPRIRCIGLPTSWRAEKCIYPQRPPYLSGDDRFDYLKVPSNHRVDKLVCGIDRWKRSGSRIAFGYRPLTLDIGIPNPVVQLTVCLSHMVAYCVPAVWASVFVS